MAIEELYADRLPEYYEMLAYHYERGEEWEKALEYLIKAGQKAQQAYANQEALGHYNQALEVCQRLGATVEPVTLLTLYAGKGAVHSLRSEYLSAVAAYQLLLEVTRQLGDRAREAETLSQIGFNFYWAHEFAQALEFSNQARALALQRGNQRILAVSISTIGAVYHVTGKLDQATRCIEEALRVGKEAGDKFIEGL